MATMIMTMVMVDTGNSDVDDDNDDTGNSDVDDDNDGGDGGHR